MNPEQVSFLTVEQRELRALARQTADLVQFMTRESCERSIQALLPLVQEAVGASEVIVPEGLDEKKGMDLIEAILERRQLPTSTVSGKPKLKIIVADRSPKGTRLQTKKRAATPEKKKADEVPKKGEGQGPPRKQSKQVWVVSDHTFLVMPNANHFSKVSMSFHVPRIPRGAVGAIVVMIIIATTDLIVVTTAVVIPLASSFLLAKLALESESSTLSLLMQKR